jgi:hypothetical protein
MSVVAPIREDVGREKTAQRKQGGRVNSADSCILPTRPMVGGCNGETFVNANFSSDENQTIYLYRKKVDQPTTLVAEKE